MFSRFAEAFQSDADLHTSYINQQNRYFSALPNMILSGTSGLNGFGNATRTVDTIANSTGNYNVKGDAIPNPEDIFMTGKSPELEKIMKQCASSDIDTLIAAKNPEAGIGCGWLYSPPTRGSPYPVLSKGFIGDNEGPIMAFEPPAYKKWYFDLREAKKQILIDKCKALKSCAEVDSDSYNGLCGFCQDTNQGVPVDKNGQLLYSSDFRANCTPESVIISKGKCPAPPPPGAGPQPWVDRTCDPVNGRLSAECMYRQVLSAGCKDSGALAIALNSNPSPNDYMDTLRNGDAVKIYNRSANPPLKLDMFSQGRATVSEALEEVRQLAGNASRPPTTSLGAAARDLCLRRGALAKFDICSELSDGSVAPFELRCLQSIFQQMGGLPNGSDYPNNNNANKYELMGNLGAVKQYWNDLFQKMNSTDYEVQRDAMIKILGIKPEKMIDRAPYAQGVEVFWFIPSQWGDVGAVGGFLKRTIERDFVQYNPQPSRFPQIGGPVNGSLLQVTDIRAQTQASVKYSVCVDDGFYITTNQPTNYDYTALTYGNVDKPGHFASMVWQGPTWYHANNQETFSTTKPNITRMYFVDGGGWMSFVFNARTMAGPNPFNSRSYSLTCEPRAPFLTYEVNIKTGAFEELRNPAIFSRLLEQRGLDNRYRTDERTNVPGKKGFARMSQNSIININNIAYQSWKYMTVMMRFNSMPVKESIINLAMGNPGTYYCNLILTPLDGSTMNCYVEYNLGQGVQQTSTISNFTLNKWTMFIIHNKGNGIGIQIYYVEDLIRRNGSRSAEVSLNGAGPLYAANATWNPISPGHNKNACNVMIGSNGYRDAWAAMYATSAFSYDTAWVHFFQKSVTDADMYREAMANWTYTQPPTSYSNYTNVEV